MSVNASMLRPVAAGLLSVLLVGAAAEPAVAAPQRAEQWYLDELRIEQVRKLSTGRSVIVGVVDSGVDATHPDLRGRVLPGGGCLGATGDGGADEDGHGTHMAGIIAATNAAADGVDGIAPGARILPIKIKKGKGRASSQAVAQGIRMAVDGGATVVNVSVGGAAAASPGEKEAITYALAKDVVVVVSAGNIAKGEKAVTSPANIPGVIAVTGTTRGGAFWSGSVQGPEAAVSAPGDGIFNIGPNHGYGWGDGTSDSAAIVSGVVALIRSKYPDLDAANVINRIIRTARDAGPAGRDPQYGFGRIDPVAALTADVPAVSENPLLGPTPPATGADQAAGDDNFDVTRYGDQGGPSDQQVAVIAVGAGLVVLILLMLTIFLIRNRRRHRAEEAVRHDLADEVPSAGFSRQSH